MLSHPTPAQSREARGRAPRLDAVADEAGEANREPLETISQPPPPPTPMQPEVFDDFVLVEKLGYGGMADVFLAISMGAYGFRKLFAVKRLHAHVEADPTSVAMFEREALLASRLHHANVVQTHKVGNFQGRHFLAMEYLDGQPLSRVLRELRGAGRLLAVHLATRIAADALEGLHYAHELTDYDGRWLNLVHRDVSPHNIFITMDGHVRVLDFGIAKASVDSELTQDGLIKGKLSYIAPEQLMGEAVDRRADVWSLAVTLWECLAGRKLIRGASDVDALRASLIDPLPKLSEIAPHVPAELVAIVEKALGRQPSDRYENALEFKLALDEWLASESVTGTRVTLSSLMRTLFTNVVMQRRLTLCAALDKLDLTCAEAAQARTSAAGAGIAPAAPVVEKSAPRSIVAAAGLLLLCAFGFNAAMNEAPSQASIASFGSSASAPVEEVASAKEGTPTAEAPKPEVRPAASDKPATNAAEAVKAPEPAPAQPSARARSSKRAAPTAEPKVAEIAPKLPGRVRLESTPYAVVSEGDRRLGITPIDVELSAGEHVLKLRNPEQGLETTYRVTVPEGAEIQRKIALD
jgi:serine/threonine protein kinase